MDGHIGVLFGVSSGMLLLALGIPLMRGMVGPNRWYGYRNRATTGEERLWYAVNAATGTHLMITGGIVLGCGLFGLLARNDPRQQQKLIAICISIITVGIGYSILIGWRLSLTIERGPDPTES